MDSSSESVVSSLGSFAEMLSDPEGYDPERLKSLSVGVPSLLSSFIEAMLSSDEEVMKRRLTDLEDYASVVNRAIRLSRLVFLWFRWTPHTPARRAISAVSMESGMTRASSVLCVVGLAMLISMVLRI